jgi:hypothetical protein
MLDDLLGEILVRGVLTRIFRIVMFPIILLLSTPFIIMRAAIFAARGKSRFRSAVVDAYQSIDTYWWN